jgi:transcription elongation GreA/GreB family factor
VLGEITKSCKKLLEKADYTESNTSEGEIEEEIRKLQERLPTGMMSKFK